MLVEEYLPQDLRCSFIIESKSPCISKGSLKAICNLDLSSFETIEICVKSILLSFPSCHRIQLIRRESIFFHFRPARYDLS